MNGSYVESPAERLAALPRADRDLLLSDQARQHGMTVDALKAMLLHEWRFVGRPKQHPPAPPWTFWWIMAGRGFGKTLTGAQWAKGKALQARTRGAVIAPTLGDVRRTCFEGEALALDTLVPTPDGFATMGALQIGDTVIGGDGKPCRVTVAHPVLYDRDCYTIRLRGGVEIVADADHRWLTESASDRESQRRRSASPRPRVVTTAEMLATIKPTSGRSRANHAIRVVAADYRDRDLPIDPYLLGAWLGDGLSKSGAICDAEGDVVDQARALGYVIILQPSSGTVPVYGILGLQKQLRAAGLVRNKHVPAAYLRADTASRLALVQGLMDTDGYVSERGQCEFVNARKHLAEALVDLLCGLGAKASAPRAKRSEVGTTHWIVKFTTTLPVFRMKRKLDRIPSSYRDAEHWRVLAITPTVSVPVRCITVDSADSTYLVTRHHVRTHNTGLLNVLDPESLLGGSRATAWNKTMLELTLANGTIVTGFSSEEPDRLRGPQHHWVWGEEVSSWKDAHVGPETEDTTFSNMTLGARLGAYPQFCLTSTPKPNKLSRGLREWAAQGRLVLVHGSSYENRVNLSAAWWHAVVAPLEGTRAGRQEIEAELLEDVEGALWTKSILDGCRVPYAPPLSRTLVAVDPNTTSGESADNAGIVIGGASYSTGHGYVIGDRTVVKGGPAVWAQAAVDAYHEFHAGGIVAEKNQGGEMVRLTIRGVDPDVPVELVTASVGKRTRGEPVAILYVDKPDIPHTIHHVGAFPELEDEMTTWVPGQPSPDRMDALVWLMTKLMVGRVSRAPVLSVPTGRLDGGPAGGLVDQRLGISGDDLRTLG